MLRSDDADGEPRVPQPDAHALAELADAVRAAGRAGELATEGELGDLPAGRRAAALPHRAGVADQHAQARRPGATARCGCTAPATLVRSRSPTTARRGPQLRRPAQRLPGGNGLIGMRERAHVYGGTLDAGPAPGGGWRVRAALPVEVWAVHVIRVLVVDDQELMRVGFRMVLGAQADIDVVGEAGDGAQAIELAARLRPDVVLMDVRMPVLDGVEATRRIVAAGTAPRCW